MNRILLTPDEHRFLDALDGRRMNKLRYHHHWGERVFSVNVFAGDLEGFVLCETESSALAEIMTAGVPPYATHEITEDPFFTGGSSCRATRAEVERALSRFS